MKKIILFLIINLTIITTSYAATANCINGECEFRFSHHYKSGKTYCKATLVNEEVQTEYLYFTITKNGTRCEVYDTN